MASCTPSIWNNGGSAQPVSLPDAIKLAQQAGFSGQGLVNAVSIAMAESGLNAASANTTTSCVGVDRGIVKFNSVYHANVPDSCAYDPACAFRQFYSISKGGTDFHEWCTAWSDGLCGTRGGTYIGNSPGNVSRVQAAMGSTLSSSSPVAAPSSSPLAFLGLPSVANVQSFFQRFAIVMFGGFLVLIGIMVVFFGESSSDKLAT